MTEAEAREWIDQTFGVPRGTRAAEFVEILLDEAERQNLIAASTVETVWSRHIVDSAQLIPCAEGSADGAWIDIGSGAGLPGMVVALLADRPVVLVEPRRRRADFLRDAAHRLGIADRVEVIAAKAESVVRPAAIISARAVAAIPELLTQGAACATLATRWLLPKGRSASAEVELARRTWHGRFRLQQSITDQESRIVIAEQVSRR